MYIVPTYSPRILCDLQANQYGRRFPLAKNVRGKKFNKVFLLQRKMRAQYGKRQNNLVMTLNHKQ